MFYLFCSVSILWKILLVTNSFIELININRIRISRINPNERHFREFLHQKLGEVPSKHTDLYHGDFVVTNIRQQTVHDLPPHPEFIRKKELRGWPRERICIIRIVCPQLLPALGFA
jgi:hypothetical protein